MRRMSRHFFALLVLCTVAFGQTLIQADREKAEQYLQQTRDGVVAATKGLSEAQMKFKPAADRWSVAETLEHITLAEDFLLLNAKDKIMKAPPGAADRDTAKIDAMVLTMVQDRTQKRQAPGPLPTGHWTPAETLDHFLKSRAQTVEFLASTPDLRDHVADSPLGQPMV